MFEAVDLVADGVLEQPLAAAELGAAQREDQPFGLVEQRLAGVVAVGDLRLDLIGGAQQRPGLRGVADDAGVFAGVAGGRHPAAQLLDRGRSTDPIDLPVVTQGVADGQVVDPAVGVVEGEHRGEHVGVLLAVEVLDAQLLIDHDRGQVALVEQHRAEHRLLGLEVVRRHPGTDRAVGRDHATASRSASPFSWTSSAQSWA